MIESKDTFKRWIAPNSAEVIGHLLSEKKITLDWLLLHGPKLNFDMVEMLLRVVGVGELNKINLKSQRIRLDYETVKILRDSGFEFHGSLDVLYLNFELYAMLALGVLRRKSFNIGTLKWLGEQLQDKEIPACRDLFALLKPIRKEKIMTVMLCLRRICDMYTMPREIIWKIVDMAYSPEEKQLFWQ